MAETLYYKESEEKSSNPFWSIILESCDDGVRAVLSGKVESPYLDAIGEFELDVEETRDLYHAMKKYYEGWEGSD